jgi:hypothetical protein
VTLDNEDEMSKALGGEPLDKLPEARFPDLVALFPQMSDELRMKLLEEIPGLQKYALDAVNAVEETLKDTLQSNAASTQQVYDALADIRSVIKGELNRPDISDERWQILMEKLSENGQMVVDKDTENKQFIAEQASESRLTKFAVAAMPYVELVITNGVRIMVTRGLSRL